MEELARRIEREAVYLGDGIVKVDGIVNHMVDSAIMTAAGRSFAERLRPSGGSPVTKVVTAETSGITPAFATAQALGVPLLFARKRRPITMSGTVLSSAAPSRTGGKMVELIVSPEYLGSGDHVVVIDDFLGTGRTLCALIDVVVKSGARLAGVGCLIEKIYERHDPRLDDLGVPLVSLVQIDLEGERVRARAT